MPRARTRDVHTEGGWAIVIALTITVVVVISLLSFLKWNSNHRRTEQLQPVAAVAESFPDPPGATVAFPDDKTIKPLQVTKGWRSAGTLDQACSAWGGAYRNWFGAEGTASVTGDYSPGQSCTFHGKKGGYTVDLQLAVYGSNQQPQATLTVAK